LSNEGDDKQALENGDGKPGLKDKLQRLFAPLGNLFAARREGKSAATPAASRAGAKSAQEQLVEAVSEVIGPVLDQQLSAIRAVYRGDGRGAEQLDRHRKAFHTLETCIGEIHACGRDLLQLAAQMYLESLGEIKTAELCLLPQVVKSVVEAPISSEDATTLMASFNLDDPKPLVQELRHKAKLAAEKATIEFVQYPTQRQIEKPSRQSGSDFKRDVSAEVSFEPGGSLGPRFR
jgi:hypothetical protein